MEFAISLPQRVTGDAVDIAALRAYLARAEELGFHSAWTQEHVIGSAPNLSPLETMTFAAACTDRLRLGCAVFVTPLHNPVHLAKSLGSLDQLSGGRLEVGIGTGGQNRMFSAFGIEPDGVVARFNEGLRLMKALWTESRVDFDGRFWQLRDAPMEPKPFQRPHPPIWIGGNVPPALRRAARDGDGFFCGGSKTTATFGEQVRAVRAELATVDRDTTGFRFAKRVYVAIDDSAQLAKLRVAQALEGLYGGAISAAETDSVAVVGPPADVARGLREVIDAGADLVLCQPLFDELDQMEMLAKEVIPRLT